MQSATFTEFRNNAKYFFDIVENGESIEMYRHGRPVAVVIPIKQHDKSRFLAIQPLKISGVSLSKALLSERKDNR